MEVSLGTGCMCDITLQILQNWWMLELQMKMTLLGHIELKIEKGWLRNEERERASEKKNDKS